MIALQTDGLTADQLEKDLRDDEQRRRARGSLIASLPEQFGLQEEQIADWKVRWIKATRGAPMTFDEAFRLAERFLTPVLAGDARGRIWSRADQWWI